ncbi:MAG: hypothetical protein K0R57_6492 [Paenibacillaceae bacterium]|jgi:hypothetical protein|nr:hypothetical protein [Paenibacillaceae bacterium]
MRENKYKIYEISGMVGYKSDKYFERSEYIILRKERPFLIKSDFHAAWAASLMREMASSAC